MHRDDLERIGPRIAHDAHHTIALLRDCRQPMLHARIILVRLGALGLGEGLFQPGQLVRFDLRMGKVDFGGVTKEVCLAYVPEAQIGNYTIVHVGFALNVLDEAEAMETLQLLREIGALDEELGAEAAAVQIPSPSGG